jgi:hypothetical protein
MQVIVPFRNRDEGSNSWTGQLPGCTSLFQRQGETSSLLAWIDNFLVLFKGKVRIFIFRPLTSVLEAIVSWLGQV